MQRTVENILSATRYVENISHEMLDDREYFEAVSECIIGILGYPQSITPESLPPLGRKRFREILTYAVDKLAEDAVARGELATGEQLLGSVKAKCREAYEALSATRSFVQ